MAKKSKGKFKGKVTSNAKKQKSQGSQYGHLQLPKGVNVFKEPTHGRVYLDFMPYEVTDQHHPDKDADEGVAVPGSLWYKRPYRIHRNIGVDNETVICRASIGKKCPICEHRAHLLREGTDYQDDTVKALKPSNRNLYCVIPKGHKEYEGKPHIWDISQFLFQEELNDELEEDENMGMFPDPEEGLTVGVRFKEDQIGKNKFGKANSITFSERDEQYDSKTLKKIPNLDEVITIPSYKEAEAKFLEYDDDVEEEDQVEEEDVEQTEAEQETEQEEDEQEEQEEQEEEKPKPTPARKRTGKKQSANKCPHNHTFGEDCEDHDECDECELFEQCLDAKEDMK